MQLLKRHSFLRISKTTGSRLATAPYIPETNSVKYICEAPLSNY